jgi:hypothetical protein
LGEVGAVLACDSGNDGFFHGLTLKALGAVWSDFGVWVRQGLIFAPLKPQPGKAWFMFKCKISCSSFRAIEAANASR